MLIALTALEDIKDSDAFRALGKDLNNLRGNEYTHYVWCYDWLTSSILEEGVPTYYTAYRTGIVVECMYDVAILTSTMCLAILASKLPYERVNSSVMWRDLKVQLPEAWMSKQQRQYRLHVKTS